MNIKSTQPVPEVNPTKGVPSPPPPQVIPTEHPKPITGQPSSPPPVRPKDPPSKPNK